VRALLALRAWKPAIVVAALAAAAALALPAGASAAFTELTPFSGTFNCPSQLAFDAGGGRPAAVYIEDPCANSATSGPPVLYAYEPNGASPDTTFAGGSVEDFNGDECFYSLTGAAVDPSDGDLYIADQTANTLFDFADNGTLNAQLGSGCTTAGPRLNGPLTVANANSFAAPQGLAVYDGNVYVAGGGTVSYTALGLGAGSVTPLTLAPNDPDPIGVAIDQRDGTMFVLDGEDDLVDEYSSTGGYEATFATGFGTPTAIAVDPFSHVVYVADAHSGTVDTFNEETGAALLETPVRAGKVPDGIALDTTNHILYVADSTAGTTGGLVDQFSYTPAPACQALSLATKGGVALNPALSCTDQAAASVSYAIASNPAHGTLSAFNPATGAVTYTPNPGYDGSDSFTYTGSSVDGESDPTTVSVAVSGPTCAAETLQTAYQQAIGVTLACSDSASPVASYRIISAPADGTLTAPTASGTLTYTPPKLFVGIDSFTFEATNASGVTSAPQTITIYVGTQLPPPVEGSSANVYFSYGTVDVLLPGQTTPIPLTGGLQAPLGSVIDATGGGAGVFVSVNGQIQSANFFSGDFKLTQGSPSATTRRPAGSTVVTGQGQTQTLLNLIGRKIPKIRCALHPQSFTGTFIFHHHAIRLGSLERASKKKFHEKGKPVRQLWGSGHGNFTMVGNGSSASVRGTEWAIFDFPDGTFTFDYTDSVSVYDYHLKKTVIITAGHYYFAALGTLPRCK
jgi:hypothetical protein